MAPSLTDARKVWYIIDQHDSLDSFAKPPLSLSLWKRDFRGPKEGGFTFNAPPPSVLEACTKEYQDLFQIAAQKLRSCGGRLVDIDHMPFGKAEDLLYNVSLIHERIAPIGPDFLEKNLDSLHLTTKVLFTSALGSPLKPWNVFHDEALQAQYTMYAQRAFNTLEDGVDVLLVPSTPCHPTIKEIEADPLGLDTKVGLFTHAGNVVDLFGVNVNAGCVEKEGSPKLPFGVMFLGGSGCDGKVLEIAKVFEEAIARESREYQNVR